MSVGLVHADKCDCQHGLRSGSNGVDRMALFSNAASFRQRAHVRSAGRNTASEAASGSGYDDGGIGGNGRQAIQRKVAGKRSIPDADALVAVACLALGRYNGGRRAGIVRAIFA